MINPTLYRNLFSLIIVSALMALNARAVEVKLTEQGIGIEAGVAGSHLLSYPRLANPEDHSSLPEQITVKADGHSATMTYSPGGKLSIDQQPDGSWLFHFTEIPSDKMKFWFGIKFPLTISGEGATWAANGQASQPFPGVKGQINLYQGNPNTLLFSKNQAGFVITCPQKTFVQVQDVRAWGKDNFNFALCYYFPGKATAPAISYSLAIGGP